MKKVIRYLLVFVSGLGAGILIAQGLIVAYARAGGNLGSEPLTILAIPALLIAGWTVGSDFHSQRDFQRAFQSGYKKGAADARISSNRMSFRITPETFVRVHEKDILKQLGLPTE